MSGEGKSKRGGGFASLTPEQRAAVSSKGGKAAHAAGSAHRWSAEEAKIAGRKGGLVRKAQKEAAAAGETDK